MGRNPPGQFVEAGAEPIPGGDLYLVEQRVYLVEQRVDPAVLVGQHVNDVNDIHDLGGAVGDGATVETLAHIERR